LFPQKASRDSLRLPVFLALSLAASALTLRRALCFSTLSNVIAPFVFPLPDTAPRKNIVGAANRAREQEARTRIAVSQVPQMEFHVAEQTEKDATRDIIAKTGDYRR